MGDEGLKVTSVKSMLWRLVERFAATFISLIVQIVLARLLSPNDYGSLALIVVFINIATLFVQSGLGDALVQSKEDCDLDHDTVLWVSITVAAAIFVVLFFIAPFVGRFYESETLVWPLRVLAAGLFLNALGSVQTAVARRNYLFKQMAACAVISSMMSGAVGIMLAVLGFGLWALVAQSIVGQVISCALMLALVPWRPHLRFDGPRAVSLFSFGWKLLIANLVEVTYQGAYDLVVGKVFSTSSLGFFNQGKKVPGTIGQTIEGVISSVMLVTFSRLQDDVALLKRAVRRSIKMATFFYAPSMACLACVASPLICILLSDKWLPAVPYLQVFCVYYSLWPIHTLNLHAMNAMGRSDLYLILELIKVPIGVVLLALAILLFQDPLAIAWGSALHGLLCTIVNAYPNKRLLDYSYREQMEDCAPNYGAALAAAIPASAIASFDFPSAVMLIAQISTYLVVFYSVITLAKIEGLSYFKETLGEVFSSRHHDVSADSRLR